jgi:hypothetical protein
MTLKDPVAVYNAANNMEATFVCNLLRDAGIDAFVTEDLSTVGAWAFGFIPEIHRPQVWTEKTDAERAKPVLDDYERRGAERRSAAKDGVTGDLEAVCEDCGRSNLFPEVLRGTVQRCRHCGAHIDVGGEDEEWQQGTDEEEGE